MPDDGIQDVKENLEFHAKKLAVLLAASFMPKGVKEALVVLLPLMSIGHMARLAEILEAKFVNDKTKAIDEEYKQKLLELAREFEKADATREVELIKQIDALI
ncbi:hypothetical protein HYV22_04105 [Candidatus Gottesmanbacteria bacterium]|nr:hypothetical protein [Candidatus Gottesmanbacteria bacterium]